uniref:Secreted protein n=1 Tax=Amblyomma parvum TaxID=251391 RepID=A0A023G0I4_AMBPA
MHLFISCLFIFLTFLPAAPFSPFPSRVPAIKSMYVCTCVTQIAVDGFNQMAASFCFHIPSSGSLPFWHLICSAPAQNEGCRCASRQKSCNKTGPHKKSILSGLVVRPDAAALFGSLLCRLLFFYVLYLKKKSCVLK